MSIKFVKHNRPTTVANLKEYVLSPTQYDEHGEIVSFATHDIEVPILLGYEYGKANDRNGTPFIMDKEYLVYTKNATNNYISEKKSSIVSSLKSMWNKAIGNIEAIPIIKDHTNIVNNTVGFSKGLVYTKKENGILYLYIDGIIKDIDSKQKIVSDDLLRNTSMGTREDGSIKEISIVNSEAIPHTGLIMSENEKVNDLQLSETQLNLMEQINDLELQENELDHIIIPNHMILAKLIKSGKLPRYMYEELIHTRNREALELMEIALPAIDIGIIYGTSKEPQPSNIIESQIKEIRAKMNLKPDFKMNHVEEKVISQNINLEDVHRKKVEHILELAEFSPKISIEYMRAELGLNIKKPIYNDNLLRGYIDDLKSLKSQKQSKKLELGEF